MITTSQYDHPIPNLYVEMYPEERPLFHLTMRKILTFWTKSESGLQLCKATRELSNPIYVKYQKDTVQVGRDGNTIYFDPVKKYVFWKAEDLAPLYMKMERIFLHEWLHAIHVAQGVSRSICSFKSPLLRELWDNDEEYNTICEENEIAKEHEWPARVFHCTYDKVRIRDPEFIRAHEEFRQKMIQSRATEVSFRGRSHVNLDEEEKKEDLSTKNEGEV